MFKLKEEKLKCGEQEANFAEHSEYRVRKKFNFVVQHTENTVSKKKPFKCHKTCCV